MKTHSVYCGIDVSKRTLHLATADKFVGEFPNNVAGHKRLVAKLSQLQPQLIVLEASGGYERHICETLQDAGLAVAIVQPGRVRHFAKSLHVLAKTDRLDAQIIAKFGEATNPRIAEKTTPRERKLRALIDRREQIVADRVRESNRLEKCADPEMAARIEAHIEHLREQEEDLDRQLDDMFQADDSLREKQTVMTTLKGVGPGTAGALLAHFPELGTLDRREVAALGGLAPHPQESGKWQGKRRIFGGRPAVRKAMYMAARSAAVWCPIMRPFYERLRSQGKSYKQAIIACARKMLVRLNTLLKSFHSTTPNPAQTT